jgi:hypothetical protein
MRIKRDPSIRQKNGTRKKRARIVALIVMLEVSLAGAQETPGTTSSQEQGNSPLAVTRSVIYFPFKGVICTVGVIASFPVYVLSGLDPQVKSDTEAQRKTYCTRDYLFSPEWPR